MSVQKMWRLGVVLALVLGGLGFFPAARPVSADPECDGSLTNVNCSAGEQSCTSNCTTDQYGQLVKSCTPGKSTAERQVNKLITYGENKQGCAIGSAVVDTCTGVVKQSSYNMNNIGEAEMCFRDSSTATLEPVCDTIEIRNGQLSCSSSCFGFDISASVTFPGFCIDVTPYPVTLVNYDTAVRNS
jgi:hypothetical protein